MDFPNLGESTAYSHTDEAFWRDIEYWNVFNPICLPQSLSMWKCMPRLKASLETVILTICILFTNMLLSLSMYFCNLLFLYFCGLCNSWIVVLLTEARQNIMRNAACLADTGCDLCCYLLYCFFFPNSSLLLLLSADQKWLNQINIGLYVVFTIHMQFL